MPGGKTSSAKGKVRTCSALSEYWNNTLHCAVKKTIPPSLSILTTIFQVNPGQPVFNEAKDDGGGNDNWRYKSCKASVKSSPPKNQHLVSLKTKLHIDIQYDQNSNVRVRHLLSEHLGLSVQQDDDYLINHRLPQFSANSLSISFITSCW